MRSANPHRRQGSRSSRRSAADVDVKAPGIIPRKSVTEQRATLAFKAIDALIPWPPVSASLLIGDRQTGKTAIALDTILNHRSRLNAQNDEKIKLYGPRSRSARSVDGASSSRCSRAGELGAGIIDPRRGDRFRPAPMQ